MFSKEEAHALAELAHQLLEGGRDADARQVIEGLLRHAPNTAWAWYAAGKLAFDTREFVKAAEFLEQAERCGAGEEAHMLWIESLVALGRLNEARQLATRLSLRQNTILAARLDALDV